MLAVRPPFRRRRVVRSPAARIPFVPGPFGAPPGALLAVPLLLVTLAGCKLVDQRTFDARADRPPVPHFPPPPPPRPAPAPLALVRFDGGDWRPAVTAIVRQALARKPEALFRVQTAVPGGGAPEQQAILLAAAARTQGAAVADTVRAAGASESQVEMTGVADPALKRVEVRLTAR